MDNRETLTPSSGDAIIKRHLFSVVAQKKMEERSGDAGGSISCADQIDRVSDPAWPLRAAQFLKPPALPGDTYTIDSMKPALMNPTSMEQEVCWRIPRLRMAKRGAA